MNSLQLLSGARGSQPLLFCASRDGTVKRWQRQGNNDQVPRYQATFAGHVDWVR